MKSKIMQEYGRQRDEGFVEMKREYQYLHMKLAHIKALVTKYDEMQVQIRAWRKRKKKEKKEKKKKKKKKEKKKEKEKKEDKEKEDN